MENVRVLDTISKAVGTIHAKHMNAEKSRILIYLFIYLFIARG